MESFDGETLEGRREEAGEEKSMTVWEKNTKRDYGMEHLHVRLSAGAITIESRRTASDGGWTTVVAAEFSQAEWADIVATVAAQQGAP
jgi:hypothetical protein